MQYVPLSKIKPDVAAAMTQRIKQLRRLMWDCMHLLAVRKNRKDGSYIVVSGHERYEYLTKHTKKKYAPCLVDESPVMAGMKSLLHRSASRRFLRPYPAIPPEKGGPAAWSIFRAFLKQEPRFSRLTRTQQIRLIYMAVRYKKQS